MWADTLLVAERAYLLRVAFWAMGSVLAGTGMFMLPAVRSGSAALLRQFALQAIGWGVVELVAVWGATMSLTLRDLGGARQLERAVWLWCGLEGGVIAAGVAIAVTAWLVSRRVAAVGAGIGIATQGAALLLLGLAFALTLTRLV